MLVTWSSFQLGLPSSKNIRHEKNRSKVRSEEFELRGRRKMNFRFKSHAPPLSRQGRGQINPGRMGCAAQEEEVRRLALYRGIEVVCIGACQGDPNPFAW